MSRRGKCLRRIIYAACRRYCGATSSSGSEELPGQKAVRRDVSHPRTKALMLNTSAEERTRQIVPSRPLLSAARRSHSAVAALNFYNAETLLAHVAAANEARVSIILQTTESTINYLGLGMIVAMANAAAKQMEKPVALHLDHGGSYELAAGCI